MNLGRAMLLEQLRGTTQRELARACRVSQPMIARLAAGYVSDSYRVRKKLHRRLGIPLDAWDQPAPRRDRGLIQTGIMNGRRP
jgi:transcriptional regulator with XRE-family HTH domain